MSYITMLLLGFAASDLVVFTGLMMLFYKMNKDVDYLKKKILRLENTIDKTRGY